MLRTSFASLVLALFAATALAKTDLPAVSHDGLHLVPDTADFDRIVRRWAELLNKHLAEVKNVKQQ